MITQAQKDHAQAYAVVYALEGQGIEVPQKALDNLQIAEDLLAEENKPASHFAQKLHDLKIMNIWLAVIAGGLAWFAFIK